jgi:hypothetical protein
MRILTILAILLSSSQLVFGDVLVPTISQDGSASMAEFNATAGGNFMVSIAGQLPADASVHWFRNGHVLDVADSSLLTLSPVSEMGSGLYYAEVAVSGSSARTQSFVLVVGPAPRLVNTSCRSYITAGGDPAILGFVTQGDGYAKKILVRVIGPSLKGLDVEQPLAQPKATLYAGGKIVADAGFNVNGNDNQFIREATAKAGAFALADGTKDLTLILGATRNTAYTVVVTSGDGTDGTVLLETYEIPY